MIGNQNKYTLYQYWFPIRAQALGTKDYCNLNGQLPTSVPDALSRPWTFPRAKNCSPALNFYTSVRTGAALSSPWPNRKVQHRMVLDFSGRGTRT